MVVGHHHLDEVQGSVRLPRKSWGELEFVTHDISYVNNRGILLEQIKERYGIGIRFSICKVTTITQHWKPECGISLHPLKHINDLNHFYLQTDRVPRSTINTRCNTLSHTDNWYT